jgi:hypothetical protein
LAPVAMPSIGFFEQGGTRSPPSCVFWGGRSQRAGAATHGGGEEGGAARTQPSLRSWLHAVSTSDIFPEKMEGVRICRRAIWMAGRGGSRDPHVFVMPSAPGEGAGHRRGGGSVPGLLLRALVFRLSFVETVFFFL